MKKNFGFPLNNSINLSSAYYFKNINDLKNYYKISLEI